MKHVWSAKKSCLQKTQLSLFGMILALIIGCATPPPAPTPPPVKPEASVKMIDLNVRATKAGGLDPDEEMEAALIANIKSPEDVIIVYDASGSMRWPTNENGEPRYKGALTSFSKYLNELKEHNNVGLIVFGSRYSSGIYAGKINNMLFAKRSCNEDIELTVPLGKFTKGAFQAELQRLSDKSSYHGDTPIGNAILKAVNILKSKSGDRKKIILITDGAEECFNAENPENSVPGSIAGEAAGKKAKEAGIDIYVAAIGLGRNKEGKMIADPDRMKKQFEKFAKAVVLVNSGEELISALRRLEILSGPFDLLDPQGKLISKFSFLDTVRLDIEPYFTYREEAKIARQKEDPKSQSLFDKLTKKEETTPTESTTQLKFNRIKFTIAAEGFRKDIGIDPNVEKNAKITIFLQLRSKDDKDPEIAPDSYNWVKQ